MEITGFCASYYHTCALASNGIVKCFGANNFSQLGLGVATGVQRGDQPNEMGPALPPVNYGSNLTPVDLVCSNTHTCLRFTNNKTKCWGNNVYGSMILGGTPLDAVNNVGSSSSHMGDNLPFTQWGTESVAQEIVAGIDHTCAILDGGYVKCGGTALYGKLGYGDAIPRGYTSEGTYGDGLPPINLGTNLKAEKIFSGSYHNCVILQTTKKVKCWGYNLSFQLGVNSVLNSYLPPDNRGDEPNEMGDFLPFAELGYGFKAIELSLGEHHTCAIREDSSNPPNRDAVCWGYAGNGELINGFGGYVGYEYAPLPDSLISTKVGTGLKAIQISVGGGVGNELIC